MNLSKIKESFRFRPSFALNKLDIKLEKYLDFKNGVFIEAGANDGLSQSNTLYFERYKNWNGLLIEPIPELAEKCRVNRPQCIVENYALVANGYPDNDIEMSYSNLMSLVKGAMKSEEEELAHIRTGCEIQKVETYDIRVPAIALSSLIEKHSITKIDLLSLDVEGFELNVLKGIDFEKHCPLWILVEARYRKEIDDFLLPLYKIVDVLSHHDVLYRLR